MKQLSRADIRVGEPLPFSVYDKDGRLLLRKGVVVAFEQQIERLIDNGLFAETRPEAAGETRGPGGAGASARHVPVNQEKTPVFDAIGSLTLRLKTTFTSFFGATPADDAAERVNAMARDIHEACARDADAAIAAIHLDFHNPYLLSHHVHSAVLCSLLGRRLGMPDDELVSAMCAALTYDIGLVDLPHLEKQREPLSNEQTEIVRRHAQKSADVLKRAGVDDETWISAVLNHHERLDGSGYPLGSAGINSTRCAFMLGMIDSYLAMIKNRPFRGAKVPLMAIREIFNEKDVKFGSDICDALVRELGMYPPGAIVRLANGEIAVVKARGAKITQPLIFSVYDACGMPLMSPRQRDGAVDENAIKEPVAHSECRAVELIIRRLWTK